MLHDPEQKARLARERRLIRKTLNGLGIHDYKVGVTGHRHGSACCFTTLPLSATAHRAQFEAAGLFVRVGYNTVTVLTGETA